MKKSRYITQIALITQNDHIGPIAEAMWKEEIPLDESINDFFEYWENFDTRSGEWNDDDTQYMYDQSIDFNTDNIVQRVLEYRDAIWVDHMKMKLDTAQHAIDDFRTGMINVDEMIERIERMTK